MRRNVRILAAVTLLLVVGGIVAVSTATAVPPTPKRYYHLQEQQCSACPPVIRTACELTGCLDTIDGGGSMCQYDCFHD